MDYRLNQNIGEFQPPTVERAIDNVKALLVGTGERNEDKGSPLKEVSPGRQNRLDNMILELLQAVSEEANPDSGIEACILVFKEK
jgi:hypothetical protein